MSFIAITTRYVGASNTHGARIIASASAGTVCSSSIAWDHSIGVDQNHAAAARKFAQRREWHGAWYGGETKTGMAFVRVPAGTDKSDSSFCC